jgi:hypothetical protein
MIEKRSCEEEIPMLGVTVGEFWAWAYSDLLNNTDRAVFAEFLVGTALGVTDVPRVPWDSVDLRYRGRKIEVKASSYVQSWHHEQDPLSQISFDLKERLSWDAATNTYQVKPGRAADCYVFCVYTETDRIRANVLEVNCWEFYVIPTERINRELGSQKSAALSTIGSMVSPVGYTQLRESVDRVV